uniref:Uncharacterized protein n=1 Tax=Ananas comosus var. bracteatus TaxID=296719 RepID=A0A6V7P8Y6_ANACO|nr:unnamed protein product [Ananas comosus var. bracteatus]
MPDDAVAKMVVKCPQLLALRIELMKNSYYYFKSEMKRPVHELDQSLRRGCRAITSREMRQGLLIMGGKLEMPGSLLASDDDEEESDDEILYRRTVSLYQNILTLMLVYKIFRLTHCTAMMRKWAVNIMVSVEVTINRGYVTPQQKIVTCLSYRCFQCRDICRPRLFRPLFGYYAEKEQCNCTKYLLIFLCKYYLFLLKLGEML